MPTDTNSVKYVLTTLPRSGTHWLKFMISHLIGHPALEERLDTDRNPRQLIDAIEHHAGERLIYEHLEHDFYGPILDCRRYPGLRIVHLYRNPLDQVVSAVHYNAMKGYAYDPVDQVWRPGEATDVQGTIRGFLTRKWMYKGEARSKDDPTLVWIDLRETIRRYVIDWLTHDNTLSVRYEDLLAGPADVLRRIAEHLNLDRDEALIQDAIARYSFETLTNGRKPGEVDESSHFRAGTTNQWTSILSAEDVTAVRDYIGDYLDIMGYPLGAEG